MEFFVKLLFQLTLVIITALQTQCATNQTSSFLPSYCPNKCGNINISYPFGVGAGCFRPGFELFCDNSRSPSELYISNETNYQITAIDIFVQATTGVLIMPSNVKNMDVSWTEPNNGPYSLLSDNSLTVIGCGINVRLTDASIILGECMTICDSVDSLLAANGSCSNIGCCQISIPYSLTSYTYQITRVEELNNLTHDYDVKAFVSSDDYAFISDDVYSGKRYNGTTRVNIRLDWNIPSPLTCEAAKKQVSTYACLAQDSDCEDTTGIGYYCTCPSGGNPYIPGGCDQQVTSNEHNITKPSLDCQRKCGNIDIPFPFGLKQDCYRNPDFALTCNTTTKTPTLSFLYTACDCHSNTEYQVVEILTEEAQLQVYSTNESIEANYMSDKPFFYSNESWLFNWVIDYITCEQAKRDKESYACVSEHSSCLTRNLTRNKFGYHCKCNQGYEGNPYLAHGCKDINECLQQEKYVCNGSCQNYNGGYICCPPGTSVDSTSRSCRSSTRRSIPVGVYVGYGLGIGLICLLLGITLIFCRRMWHERTQKKMRQKYFYQNKGLLLQQLISCNEDVAEKTKIFSSEELEKATGNFDRSRIVGRGGHGTVFKGMLSDQRVVAIKKSKLTIKREIDQFINEVVILSRINHRNIVKLFGCCLETEVPLLVYEFISNGTLHDHLHCTDLKSTLSWDNRLRIASETAGALSYLHSAATISIFHRDVKSANILLDEYLTAKVSDFGASRSIPINQTLVATVVQGTYGYLDPEYHHTGQLTEKSDVYSFGVILVELLTGEMPICLARVEEERNLSIHFLRAIKDNSISEIVEARVKEESTTDELGEFIHLAEVCLRLKGEERPTMKEIEFKLQCLRMIRKQKKEQETRLSLPSEAPLLYDKNSIEATVSVPREDD